MTEISFPEAGNLWPTITRRQRTNEQVQLELHVSPALACFDGHFPGHPVLPGVVQVFWAEYLSRRFDIAFPDAFQLKNLKFNRMVTPGMQLTLTLQMDRQKHRIKFTYRQDGDLCSSGTFEGHSP